MSLNSYAQEVTIYVEKNPPLITITKEDVARGYKDLTSRILIRNDEEVKFTYITQSYWFKASTKVIIHPGYNREIDIPVRVTIDKNTATGEYSWPLKIK